MAITVVVSGAKGRMGRETVKAIEGADDLSLIGTADVGDDLDALLAKLKPNAMVDFTTPESGMPNIRIALKNGVVPIVGTTGISAEDRDEVAKLCKKTETGALIAPNFALGAVLLMRFSREAAAYFPDAEIIEMHHEKKLDAPSGTAAATAEGIAEGRRGTAPTNLPSGAFEKIAGSRGGKAAGDIPVHSVRLPGFVASEMVVFGGLGQTLTLRHDTIDRTSFMPGVLLALRKVPVFGPKADLIYGLENIL
jgi:4-hydroxy-tetrahydrodipicolinate reductase